MVNKVIIGILVLLLILMGGISYYSYTLSQQIDYLSGQLTAFEMEQTARIDVVSSEIIEFRGEALSSVNALEDKLGDKIDEAMAEIDTLEKETEEATSGVASQVDLLEDRLTELSRSRLDASEVYQKVIQATVRIGNEQNTAGSGVILDTKAHVLTAYHVVEGLSEKYVTLHDGRVFRATTVGGDEASDVAILRLTGNPNIEPPPLADSSQVSIGEPVVAIGSPRFTDDPHELRDTLTSGIISQVNRYIDIENQYIANLLQFDAAVNFGNSGGPLFNANGEVIGIVIARVDPSEGDGIYYAVAANKVKRVAEALIKKGSFDYPLIGTEITDLTPQIVKDMALETANGVLVTSVSSSGPAEAGGIQADDVIISMDGVPVRDSGELTSYLGEFKSPGDTAIIGLIRGTSRLELSIEVGER